MSKTELGSGTPSVALTFAHWKRAPVACLMLVTGRALVGVSDAFFAPGMRLYDWSLARLERGQKLAGEAE